MATASFIDTSVLLDVLDVPKNNQHHAEDAERFTRRVQRGSTLIMSVTAIIEAGKTLAKTGDHRLHQRFIAMLQAAADNEEPRIATTLQLDATFLRRLLDGDGHLAGLASLLTAKVGAGDATILHEVLAYRRRVPSSTRIEIWTHDQQLRGQASVVCS